VRTDCVFLLESGRRAWGGPLDREANPSAGMIPALTATPARREREVLSVINKVILIGNLGRDPEIRTTPNGQTVAKFSLATTRVWRDRDGNRQERTEWHNIVAWGRQAEVAGQYLTKGRQLYVEGRLQTDSWEDRETGKKMYRTEIVCDNFQMLGQRGDSAGASRPSPGGEDSTLDSGPVDDDIPF
jgi:single-strand DNA-binding protein